MGKTSPILFLIKFFLKKLHQEAVNVLYLVIDGEYGILSKNRAEQYYYYNRSVYLKYGTSF